MVSKDDPPAKKEETSETSSNANESNQATSSNTNASNQSAPDPNASNQPAVDPNASNQPAPDPNASIQPASDPNASNQPTSSPEATDQQTPSPVTGATVTFNEIRAAPGAPPPNQDPEDPNVDATGSRIPGQPRGEGLRPHFFQPRRPSRLSDPEALRPILLPFPDSPRRRSSASPGSRAVKISMHPDQAPSACGLSVSSVETFDADILEVILFHLDDFGRYQKWLLVMMIPFSVIYALVYYAPFFLIVTPQTYWCIVPELAGLSKEMRRNLSAPGADIGEWDGCWVYVADWKTVIETKQPPPRGTPMEPCTRGWEFDYEDIPYETVTSERGWVCDQASYVPTSQSMFFAGSLVGGLIFGWMADSFGRIPALIGVNLVGGISGVATVYTRGAWDFIFSRFLLGIAYDNCMMLAYILVLEYVGPTHRTLVANLPIALYYGAASVAVPWVAYYIANWRLFTWVTSIPMFIVILTPWVMPESVRWLSSRGRVDDAVKVLRKFERINRTVIPDTVMEEFLESTTRPLGEQQSFRSICNSQLLRSTAIFMTLTYCGCDLVYDALVRLSESFGVDIFLTFTINALAEIPSVIMVTLLLDRLGRRNLTWGPITMAGICMFIAIFVPKGVPRVSFAIAARFFVNLSSTVTVQWGTEILPTPIRAFGSAALHMSGFATSLFSPFIVYSERYWDPLPLVILCVTALLSGGFSLVLPETKDQEMPQTVADCEKIISEYSLFGRPEIQELKTAMGKVFSTTFSSPITKHPVTRVSRLSLATRSKSKASIGRVGTAKSFISAHGFKY